MEQATVGQKIKNKGWEKLNLIIILFLASLFSASSQDFTTKEFDAKTFSSITNRMHTNEAWIYSNLKMKDYDTSNYLVTYNHNIVIPENAIITCAKMTIEGGVTGEVSDIESTLFDFNANTVDDMFIGNNQAHLCKIDSIFERVYFWDSVNVSVEKITSSWFGAAFRVVKESDSAYISIKKVSLAFCYNIPTLTPEQDIGQNQRNKYYYDLNGNIVDENILKPGFYIVEQGDESKKIFWTNKVQ